MKIEYIEKTLEQVIRYYAKDFNPKDGIVYNFEYFVDPTKDRVIFKLFIEEEKDK